MKNGFSFFLFLTIVFNTMHAIQVAARSHSPSPILRKVLMRSPGRPETLVVPGRQAGSRSPSPGSARGAYSPSPRELLVPSPAPSRVGSPGVISTGLYLAKAGAIEEGDEEKEMVTMVTIVEDDKKESAYACIKAKHIDAIFNDPILKELLNHPKKEKDGFVQVNIITRYACLTRHFSHEVRSALTPLSDAALTALWEYISKLEGGKYNTPTFKYLFELDYSNYIDDSKHELVVQSVEKSACWAEYMQSLRIKSV